MKPDVFRSCSVRFLLLLQKINKPQNTWCKGRMLLIDAANSTRKKMKAQRGEWTSLRSHGFFQIHGFSWWAQGPFHRLSQSGVLWDCMSESPDMYMGAPGGIGEESWLYKCAFPDLNHKLWEQVPENLYFRMKQFFFLFWLHWVFIASRGPSLAVTSSGYSLAAVCKLLFAVASLVVEHGP